MKLHKHIEQGRLLDTCSDAQGVTQEVITIVENDCFRWMAFDGVIQSVMNKRKPYLLTLPHQRAMLLPLLFFKPKNIVELGLGAGNIQRFMSHLSAQITTHSIEHNSLVVDCFNKYFNPEQNQVHIIFQDSSQWLLEKEHHDYDWFICDIYQQNLASYDNTIKQLTALTSHINSHTCLSINMPDATDNEVDLCLMLLKELSSDHDVFYFHIPNYLNVIIHLIPKQWHTQRLLKRNKHSYLPKYLFARWRRFWQLGGISYKYL